MIEQQDQDDVAGGELEDSPETIRLARDMGWKDPAEWQGNPPKNGFVSASEYVRRSEKILPIVNARAKAAEERAEKLESKLEQMERDHRDNLRRIERMSIATLEQQRAQIEAKYAERIEAAAELGDKEAVRQARKDEKEAYKALDDKLEPSEEEKKTAASEPARLPKAQQDVIDEWMANNRWYRPGSDDEMTIVATRRHFKLNEEKKGLTLAENLAEVSKYIRKRYPEEFGEDDTTDDDHSQQRRGSRVEGASRASNGISGNLWSKVPAENRKLAVDAGHIEFFLKPGETMEKNAAQARERWASKYFEGEQP